MKVVQKYQFKSSFWHDVRGTENFAKKKVCRALSFLSNGSWITQIGLWDRKLQSFYWFVVEMAIEGVSTVAFDSPTKKNMGNVFLDVFLTDFYLDYEFFQILGFISLTDMSKKEF